MSPWNGLRVLVTGHTGFKGAWLTLWLHALGAEGGPLFLAVVLLSTSLGVIVPVLKDEHEVNSDFGQLVMVAGSLAEFGSLLLLTLLFSTGDSASSWPISCPMWAATTGKDSEVAWSTPPTAARRSPKCDR